jgi:peroxiredoxin Q/BCP
MLKVGTRAPAFEARLDDGGVFRSADVIGKRPLVLYFYPKDFTLGCTREACDFRERWEDITARGAALVGVSADSAESHGRFREKHNLPFPLIADQDRRVIDAYGARGPFGLGTARVTYVIDTEGTVRAAFHHEFLIGRHVEEVLKALDALAPSTSAT